MLPGDKQLEDHRQTYLESLPHVRTRSHSGPTGVSLVLKRGMDIVGSSVALLLGAPLLVCIAVAVKLTSEGAAVLFRQTRHGQYGKPFTFFKFRSMYISNDSKIHQEFVKKLITGKQNPDSASGSSTSQVFKIVNDPRVTRVGYWLRKTSMDEIPQFLNVLKGEMSLVGPRPPLTYELEDYDEWHHHRLDVKPGITGLWQVMGRSRTTFDEMVRMDLEYVQTWSLWLDIKILLRTPLAVLMGDGAY